VCICVSNFEPPCDGACCPQGAVCSSGTCVCIGGLHPCGGTQCCDPAFSFCCDLGGGASGCCPSVGAICYPGVGCFLT
jgi:hypothetical protein